MFETLETRRHLAFGQAIKSFGVKGFAESQVVSLANGNNGNLTTQTDGKVVGGFSGGLVRFNTDGSIDKTFGVNGFARIRGVVYKDHAIDTQNRLYVLATNISGTLLIRYGANGQVDTSYALGGTALIDTSRKIDTEAVSVGTDGSIAVLASITNSTTGNELTRVYKFAPSGAVDANFGTNGIAEFQLGKGNYVTPEVHDNPLDLKILSDGKVVVAGSSYSLAPAFYDSDTGFDFPEVDGDTQAVVGRLTTAGVPDGTFGSGGFFRKATFDESLQFAKAAVIRADGTAMVEVEKGDSIVYVSTKANGTLNYSSQSLPQDDDVSPFKAIALSDGRTLFVGEYGGDLKIWTVSSTGKVSFVTSSPSGIPNSMGIGIAGDGKFLVGGITSSSTYRLAKIDLGKVNDPRPDEFANVGASKLVRDDQGGLHLAFYDTVSKTVKYAYRGPNGLWNAPITVDSTIGAGTELSIDARITSTSRMIAIGYYASVTGDLKVAYTQNQKTFIAQTVVSKGIVGQSPSIKCSDNGWFAVSFYSKTGGNLLFAIYNGKKWGFGLVDGATTDVGKISDMQIDAASRHFAIAYSGENNSVKYALQQAANLTSWEIATVAQTKKGATAISLSVPYYSSYTGPLVSYYDTNTNDFMLARYYQFNEPGKRWVPSALATSGNVGVFNNLFTDDNGNATAFAYRQSSDLITMFTSDSEGNTTSLTLVSAGGRNLTSTIALFYDHAFIDIAYIDTASGKLFVR